MSLGVCGLSARELLAEYRGGALSPVEVVDASLERIEAVDPELGAITTACAERAREEARASERAHRAGGAGPLAGVPFVVKDLFDSEGVRTTYGSPMFADHVPDADAAVVRHVRGSGGVLVGKAQTHEFAWGITSVNELMGTSRNPWDTTRISGGSSGGSAVALAAHLAPLAIGSDTGGSIRVPSGYCGTVGFKPTFGRLSTEGVLPLAPSLDHPGSMARTPADAALLLWAMDGDRDVEAGLAELDRAAAAGLGGRRVGVCTDMHTVQLDPAVQASFDAAVEVVRGLGAEIVELSLPDADAFYPTFGAIQRAEALRSHRSLGLYPSRRDEYGADVRGRMEAAEAVGLDDYVRATSQRERSRAAVAALFERVDVLLTPVAAGPPVPIGVERLEHLGREIEFRELVMSYTVPQDLLGIPACAVRAGFDELGIPIGVQFTGPRWGDELTLAVAQAFFDATPELQRRWPQTEEVLT